MMGIITAVLRKWLNSFVARATNSLNLVAIVITIFAISGLSLTGSGFQIPFIIVLAAIILLIAWKSFPEVYYHPQNFVSRTLSISELDKFIVPIPRVGLIGKQDVGKTSFFDAAVARRHVKQQTDKPYVQIVALPDTSPTQYIALIDTVGDKDFIQYDIQKQSNRIILFIDHAEGEVSPRADQERIKQQRYFADQLINARVGEVQPNRVLLVTGKYDLWKDDAISRGIMASICSDLTKNLKSSNLYKQVEIFENYSNRNHDNVSDLLRRIGRNDDNV